MNTLRDGDIKPEKSLYVMIVSVFLRRMQIFFLGTSCSQLLCISFSNAPSEKEALVSL